MNPMMNQGGMMPKGGGPDMGKGDMMKGGGMPTIPMPAGWKPDEGQTEGEAMVGWYVKDGKLCLTSFDGHPLGAGAEGDEGDERMGGMSPEMAGSMKAMDELPAD